MLASYAPMVRVWKPKPIGKGTLTAPWNLPHIPKRASLTQPVQQPDQHLALFGIERRQRFLGDRQRMRRGFFRHLLARAGQADEQAGAVPRIRTRFRQPARGEAVDDTFD